MITESTKKHASPVVIVRVGTHSTYGSHADGHDGSQLQRFYQAIRDGSKEKTEVHERPKTVSPFTSIFVPSPAGYNKEIVVKKVCTVCGTHGVYFLCSAIQGSMPSSASEARTKISGTQTPNFYSMQE